MLDPRGWAGGYRYVLKRPFKQRNSNGNVVLSVELSQRQRQASRELFWYYPDQSIWGEAGLWRRVLQQERMVLARSRRARMPNQGIWTCFSSQRGARVCFWTEEDIRVYMRKIHLQGYVAWNGVRDNQEMQQLRAEYQAIPSQGRVLAMGVKMKRYAL